MKICLLSSMHPPRDKRVFDKEAISLVHAGYQVTHLCPGSPDDSGLFKGVEIVTYPKPSELLGRIKQLFQLYRVAKNIDCDCYHCNEVDSWLIGVLLKITTGRKCIFDVHEHYPSNFAQMHFPRVLRPVAYGFIILIFRILLPFTDRLVLAKKTVSQDFPCKEAKKVLVHNFTPVSGLNFAKNKPRLQAGEIVTMIHLGLFNKKRGWPQVLDAMNLMKHKNIRLKVIGEINDGTQAEFEETLQRYGLSERVEIYEWMPFEQAFDHLVNAHIGLVAFQPGILNHVYAMPHKMFDYMAAGMAVICPDFAVEVAPVVDETYCGILVDPSNPEELAKKLDELVECPERIQEMGLNGQKAVRDQYNWEAEAKHLIKMYEALGKIS